MAQRLLAAGYTEVPDALGLGSEGGVRAFRRSDFKVSWVFTRLHTFVVVRPAPEVSALQVEDLLRDSVAWAKSVKGGLSVGLQTGVAVLGVLVTELARDDAVRTAAGPLERRWAAMPLPVVVDVHAGRSYTASGSMIWGALYQDHLAQQQQLVLADPDVPTLRMEPASRRRRQLAGVALSALVIVMAVIAAFAVVSAIAG
jgi:hypothetical protein